jgi:hypothetical protein
MRILDVIQVTAGKSADHPPLLPPIPTDPSVLQCILQLEVVESVDGPRILHTFGVVPYEPVTNSDKWHGENILKCHGSFLGPKNFQK